MYRQSPVNFTWTIELSIIYLLMSHIYIIPTSLVHSPFEVITTIPVPQIFLPRSEIRYRRSGVATHTTDAANPSQSRTDSGQVRLLCPPVSSAQAADLVGWNVPISRITLFLSSCLHSGIYLWVDHQLDQPISHVITHYPIATSTQ